MSNHIAGEQMVMVSLNATSHVWNDRTANKRENARLWARVPPILAICLWGSPYQAG